MGSQKRVYDQWFHWQNCNTSYTIKFSTTTGLTCENALFPFTEVQQRRAEEAKAFYSDQDKGEVQVDGILTGKVGLFSTMEEPSMSVSPVRTISLVASHWVESEMPCATKLMFQKFCKLLIIPQ